MRTEEQLDSVAVIDMSQAEFLEHALAVCVRRMDDSSALRVEPIADSGFASRETLLREAAKSFRASGQSDADAVASADRLLATMLGTDFEGDIWHVRLERAKTLVLVKASAAVDFSLGEVLRAVYSDATCEAAIRQERESKTVYAAGFAA